MKILVCSIALVCASAASAQGTQALHSPDGTLHVKVAPGPAGVVASVVLQAEKKNIIQ